MNKRTLSSQPKNKSGGVKPTLEDPFLKPAPPNHKFQQAALCWLKLNLKLSYSGTMKQSITLTLGLYWEKCLTAAQRPSRALVRLGAHSETFTQDDGFEVQHSHKRREAGEPHKLTRSVGWRSLSLLSWC